MRIHLIAIGGSAMHNLALALQANGHQVSGSDDEIYDPARSRLAAEGLLPHSMGWNPDLITSDIDVIIVGMHARPENPELKKAKDLGLEIHSYPSYLYEHAKNKTRIVVAGSHGKTTTTAIIMHALQKSNTSFDYMVGAQLQGFKHMVRLSDAAIMVLEGDEYLSSPLDRRSKFIHYRPHLAILTGIAWDHINVFPTFDSYLDTFRSLFKVIEPAGKLYYFAQDAEINKLIAEESFSFETQAYEGLTEGKSPGTVSFDNQDIATPLFGAYNLQNMNAAWLVCQALGISEKIFANAMQDFAGPALRMQKEFESENIAVFRDFAHAPSKLKASIKALKNRFPRKKLNVVFELHTFSSLNQEFIPHYKDSLAPADEAVVFYLPHTLEMKKMPPLDANFIRESFGRPDLVVIDSTNELEKWLINRKEAGGIFAMMSSGNFGKLSKWF